MQLKLRLLSILLLAFSINLSAQEAGGDHADEINPSIFDQYNLECLEDLPVVDCNLFRNFMFAYNASGLQAFSLGNVFAWQSINSLTPDINGALGEIQGWNIPSVPGNLGAINFASMLVDNLNQETEGISSQVARLEPGKKYALSFFLASTFLNKYRSGGGRYRFKIVLSNCQNFSREQAGNPEFEGETQVIFCRGFSDAYDSEWQQYFFTFEAEQEYNTITIYPELDGESFDGGAYVHFANPELVPVNPVATFLESEAGNGKTLLSACGVANATYLWESTSGESFDQLNVTIEDNQSAEYEYTFSMEVPGAIGNSVEACDDEDAPRIYQNAGKQLSTLSVDCVLPVNASGCNLIPNPRFLAGVGGGLDPFTNGFVSFWTSCVGSPDVSGFGATPLPTYITDNTATNYASIAAASMPGYPFDNRFIEGIAAKTKPIQATKEYIFSFFIDPNFVAGSTDLTFTVDLATCQTFPNTTIHNYLNILGSKQTIFCEPNQPVGNSWRQYVVRFIANGNYDMILFYPSVHLPQNATSSYMHIAYPELVEVIPLTITTTSTSCGYTLTASSVCTVKNSVYTWTDQNGVFVGSGQQINVGSNAATYTCTVAVLNAVQNPNNNCSDNNPIQSASVTVAAIPQITGTVTYTKSDQPSATYPSSWSWSTETLAPCSTSLCLYGGRQIFLDLQSPFPTGNFWEVTLSDPSWPLLPPISVNGNQTCHAEVYTPWYFSGYVKIKLTNNGNVYTYNVYTHGIIGYPVKCNSIDPAYTYRFSIDPHWGTDPSNSYLWTFPAGMEADNPVGSANTSSSEKPKLRFGSYTGTSGNAHVDVTNHACNITYTYAFIVDNSSVFCDLRPGKDTFPAMVLPKTKKLLVYPNPTSGFLYLKEKESVTTIEIFTIEGKRLNQFTKPVSNKIDISTFNSGSYLIIITDKDGKKDSQIILKL